jgi:hypothetical protein
LQFPPLPSGARPLRPVFAERYCDIIIGDRDGIICKGSPLHAPRLPGWLCHALATTARQ